MISEGQSINQLNMLGGGLGGVGQEEGSCIFSVHISTCIGWGEILDLQSKRCCTFSNSTDRFKCAFLILGVTRCAA